MWLTKIFKNQSDYLKWMNKNKNKYQYERIFVNNVEYAIEYKKLRKLM